MNTTLAGGALPSVTILLSTFNGERFLTQQLDSFLRQTYRNWTLLWRDDGSTDRTRAIMHDFRDEVGANRCVETPDSGQHVGAMPSFMRLLRQSGGTGAIAFADQDDVWLPDKLADAAAHVEDETALPVLYCARQYRVDHNLQNGKLSVDHGGLPGFPACLTQNIANGNTLVMNAAAVRLVSALDEPDGTVHDWWSYIAVSACGGRIVFDPKPQVLYRLHKANLIGAARPMPKRAMAAIQRGPEIFMTMMRRHATALLAQPARLTPQAGEDLRLIRDAMQGGSAPRLKALQCKRFRRDSLLENILFRYWFLTG